MASPSLLDFDALLAPIDGDSPAGAPVSYELRTRFDELRKEQEADAEANIEEKRADWPAVVRLCKETLAGQSKDLLVAARMTEGLVKRHGFAGLRDGMQLMRRLVDECWDRIHPLVEEPDDLERRAGPFNWLDVPDRGARFPSSLRMVPLISDSVREPAEGEPYTAVVGYSFLDWKPDDKGVRKVSQEDYEKMLHQTPAHFLRATAEDIEGCVEEIVKTVEVLNARLESNAPALTGIRAALADNRALVQDMLKLAPQAASAELVSEGESEGETGTVVATRGGSSAPAASREEAYRQLAQAASVLRQLEPHSPIPYLVDRAVHLGRLPFPQLIRQLFRETTQLNELFRELGISTDDSQPTTSSEG